MTLLQMSIQAGILIIGIVLIRALGMNKLPKKSFLILWDIVLIKLLVPLSFPAKWNILTFFNELQKDVGKTSASVQAEINIALADFRILPLEQLIASKTTIMRPSYTAWYISYFLIAIGATWLLSAPRYLITLIPVPLAVSLVSKKATINIPISIISGILYTLYFYAFVMRWQVW